MKTAINGYLETLKDRHGQYGQLKDDCHDGSVLWFEYVAKQQCITAIINDLQSLLPAEKKQIEAAFDAAREVRHRPVSMAHKYKDASDYYLTTFKTDKNGE